MVQLKSDITERGIEREERVDARGSGDDGGGVTSEDEVKLKTRVEETNPRRVGSRVTSDSDQHTASTSDTQQRETLSLMEQGSRALTVALLRVMWLNQR